MANDAVSILLVEDDVIDVRLVKRMFAKKDYISDIIVASDGYQALNLLHGKDRSPESTPLFVLLDLNLPRMSGIEFLEVLRSDVNLCSTLVFVLTTSNADQDKALAHKHNVAGYFVKSEAGPRLTNLVPLFEQYIKLAEFPQGPVS